MIWRIMRFKMLDRYLLSALDRLPRWARQSRSG
jgi:hypothetical protein